MDKLDRADINDEENSYEFMTINNFERINVKVNMSQMEQ